MGKGEDWIKPCRMMQLLPYEYSKSIALYLKNKEYDLQLHKMGYGCIVNPCYLFDSKTQA